MRFRVPLLTVLAIVLAFGGVLAQNSAGPAPGTPVRLTATGFDRLPVYSPNGRRIAFNSFRNDHGLGGGDIYVMNPDGSEQQDLTNVLVNTELVPIANQAPVWSPNGKQILFAAGHRPAIYVVDADGTADPVRLTDSPDTNNFAAQWSPNGAQIVFVRDIEIWVMNADGTGATALTTGGSPVWSPSGRQIAFVRFDGSGTSVEAHIFVMNADGTDVTALTTGSGFLDLDPQWSPNGQAISFLRVPSNLFPFSSLVGDLFVIDRDGGNLTDISNGITTDAPGVWSPNGQRIALSGVDRDIYVVNPDGTGLVNVTDSPTVFEVGPPSWSRDGRRLAYSSGLDFGAMDIFTILVGR